MNDYSDVANINIGDLNRYTPTTSTTPIYNVWSPNPYNTYTGGYCVSSNFSNINSLDVQENLKERIDKLEADNYDLLKRISQLETQLHYELSRIHQQMKNIGILPDVSDMV